MPDPTPPLWFTRAATAHLEAAARKGVRRAAAAVAAGRVTPADWSALVAAAVAPAVAAAARLARAAEFGVSDRADLYERVAQVRRAADDLSHRLHHRAASAQSAGLALAGAVRATAAAYERRGRAATGPGWERRIAGPGCPPACRSSWGAWRPAGELPTPGDSPDCLCRLEYFAGAEPPALLPPRERVSFRLWTAAEVSGLSPARLRDLSPDDAADALAQLGAELDDDARAALEGVTHRAPDRAAPPNPAGNHFSLKPDRHDLLPFLVAVPDPTCPDLCGAAHALVRAARTIGADSRAAYFCPAAGRYEPGRAALHERLAREAVFAVPPADGPPQAVVAVGPALSGKTAAATRVAAAHCPQWATADATALAARLPEYQGWNRALLAAEAGDVAARVVALAAATGRHVVVECHGGEPFAPGQAAHLLARTGHAVHAVAAHCDPAAARARAAARFAENPFGLVDPAADPSPFAADPGAGTRAGDVWGYPGLATRTREGT